MNSLNYALNTTYNLQRGTGNEQPELCTKHSRLGPHSDRDIVGSFWSLLHPAQG